MAINNIGTGFVTLGNIVMDILLEIGDSEQKKYQDLVLQRTINCYRDINVSESRYYEEEPVELDTDLRTGKYPNDLVELLSVGIYRNGKFWSFTHEPDMAKTTTGLGEGYDEDFNENDNIPKRGFIYGARGANSGYWVEDDKNRRFIVRNYEQDKVILRYKSNGMSCNYSTCVPYIAKNYLTNKVKVELALDGIPRQFTAAELQLKTRLMETYRDKYTDAMYVPKSFDEFMDAIFSSLNNVPRRG